MNGAKHLSVSSLGWECRCGEGTTRWKTPTRNARIGRSDTTHDCCREGASGSRRGTAGGEECQPRTLIAPLWNAALASHWEGARTCGEDVRKGDVNPTRKRRAQSNTYRLLLGGWGTVTPPHLQKNLVAIEAWQPGGILPPSVLEIAEMLYIIPTGFRGYSAPPHEPSPFSISSEFNFSQLLCL